MFPVRQLPWRATRALDPNPRAERAKDKMGQLTPAFCHLPAVQKVLVLSPFYIPLHSVASLTAGNYCINKVSQIHDDCKNCKNVCRLVLGLT
jgi:hypothetical protein